MDTWETKEQKWYRENETNKDLQTYNAESIEKAMKAFIQAQEYTYGHSSTDFYYNGKHILLLLRKFFEKKRILEQRCYFCHATLTLTSGEKYNFFYELYIDGFIYYFKQEKESYLIADSANVKIKRVPGLPDTKAHPGLIAKWFKFMNENGYFESLDTFSKNLGSSFSLLD